MQQQAAERLVAPESRLHLGRGAGRARSSGSCSGGPRSPVSGDVPERFLPALRAGARYVATLPLERRPLLRSALFVLPGTAP